MDLTEDETVALGTYCEALMQDASFNTLARYFELSIYQSFMSTGPLETQKREKLYAEHNGVHNFLSMMKALVMEKDKILNPALSPEDDDAQEMTY